MAAGQPCGSVVAAAGHARLDRVPAVLFPFRFRPAWGWIESGWGYASASARGPARRYPPCEARSARVAHSASTAVAATTAANRLRDLGPRPPRTTAAARQAACTSPVSVATGRGSSTARPACRCPRTRTCSPSGSTARLRWSIRPERPTGGAVPPGEVAAYLIDPVNTQNIRIDSSSTCRPNETGWRPARACGRLHRCTVAPHRFRRPPASPVRGRARAPPGQ